MTEEVGAIQAVDHGPRGCEGDGVVIVEII